MSVVFVEFSVCVFRLTWCYTITELWGVENSFFRMRGKVKRSEGSGMLIGNPLGEGSNASSTSNKLWRVENLFLIMRGNSDAQKGAACS